MCHISDATHCILTLGWHLASFRWWREVWFGSQSVVQDSQTRRGPGLYSDHKAGLPWLTVAFGASAISHVLFISENCILPLKFLFLNPIILNIQPSKLHITALGFYIPPYGLTNFSVKYKLYFYTLNPKDIYIGNSSTLFQNRWMWPSEATFTQ